MTETAGKYCISMIEIQHGFHDDLTSSQHTKEVLLQLWESLGSRFFDLSGDLAGFRHQL